MTLPVTMRTMPMYELSVSALLMGARRSAARGVRNYDEILVIPRVLERQFFRLRLATRQAFSIASI